MANEITAPISKEGLMGYFEQFLGGVRGETSADVISDVLLLAVAEERAACAATVEQVAGAWAAANGIKDYPMMDEIAETIRRRGRWYPAELPQGLTAASGGQG